MVAFANILCHLMMFVTDCDGTIVHYHHSDDLEGVIELPASAGSGRIGLTSKNTVASLGSISEFARVICASGMRESTMRQRQPYFPSVSYWICENGGRIFQSMKDGSLEEILEWREKAFIDSNGMSEIKKLVTSLRLQGWVVDDDYLTMIRIKGNGSLILDTSIILEQVPSVLKTTMNLGFLDVYLPYSGKLAAVRWLISKLQSESKSREISSNFVENSDSLSESGSTEFYFMGDDDNDVEISAAAKKAFVVQPCSKLMRSFVASRLISAEAYLSSEETDSSPPPVPRMSVNSGIRATEELLAEIVGIFVRMNDTISVDTEL